MGFKLLERLFPLLIQAALAHGLCLCTKSFSVFATSARISGCILTEGSVLFHLRNTEQRRHFLSSRSSCLLLRWNSWQGRCLSTGASAVKGRLWLLQRSPLHTNPLTSRLAAGSSMSAIWPFSADSEPAPFKTSTPGGGSSNKFEAGGAPGSQMLRFNKCSLFESAEKRKQDICP